MKNELLNKIDIEMKMLDKLILANAEMFMENTNSNLHKYYHDKMETLVKLYAQNVEVVGELTATKH